MAEEVTVMLLKVDLQCPCCYKKVKKILCKFPQIRDQEYNERQNLVKITVVCCNPEKTRDKLCCKGGKVIKSIEIVEPPPPAKPKPKPTPKPVEKPPEKKSEPAPPPTPVIPPPPPPAQVPAELHPHPRPHPPVPVGFCCVPCSEGYVGGPCYYGYGRPVPPPPPTPCYDSCYGYGYGYGKGCYVSRCDYFSEETTGGCTIM